MNRKVLLVLGLALVLTLCASAALADAYTLNEGMNVLTEGASGKTFVIDEGKALAIKGTADQPLTFSNCTFEISGSTMSFSGSGVGYVGETQARLGVSGYTTFNDCTFIVSNGGTNSTNGNDACIQFFQPDITFNGGSITSTGWKGQFMGLYGTADVTFKNAKVGTVGNVGGWSYAMYGTSAMRLEGSELTAYGMVRAEGGGSINAFYSGDHGTNYEALFVTDSTIDFSDNQAGGFAINRITIRVDNSRIIVNNNAGNASNSGMWYVKNNSVVEMCGNKGGHGWSHISDECENSTITIMHNGYAGYYLQSGNGNMTNCTVNIRCNGEKLLSYTAGDTWLVGHTLTLTNCRDAWLGGVGRTGQVVSNLPLTAYDLYENKTKSDTEPVLTGVTLLNQDTHVLFLNPDKDFDYARGDTENETGNSNDDDLFEDVGKATAIGRDTAKIGALTTAQLSHHKYDWTRGVVTDNATPDAYGVVRYECTDVCATYANHVEEHPWSFDCDGTYVYAPLVGIHFDKNTDATVTGMPGDQLTIAYGGNAAASAKDPARTDGMVFDGWYLDAECTTPFDFSTALTANYTVVYAGWKPAPVVPPQTGDDSTPLVWLCALLGCAACLSALWISRRRRA